MKTTETASKAPTGGMAQSAATKLAKGAGALDQTWRKKQSDIPVGRDFENVQRVIESDPTLLKLAGAPTLQTELASGEKIMVSLAAKQVAQALIEEGKRPRRASTRAILKAAGRLVREKRFGLTGNGPVATPLTPKPVVVPKNEANKPVPSCGEVQTPSADGGGAGSGTAPTASPATCAPTSTAGAVTDQIEIKHGDAKGVYPVHPVAMWFPLMEGKARKELKRSIQIHGQQEQVVLDGDVLLDGRNRVLTLNELGIDTITVQFADLKTGLSAGDWIVIKNSERRHLSDDQRLAITAKYQAWSKDEQARQAEDADAGQPDDGESQNEKPEGEQSKHAEKSGDSEYRRKSAENAGKRKRGRPPGNRSDARALATKTQQSRNRAERILKLQKQAPELAEAVAARRLTLKAAWQQFQAQQQPKKTRGKYSTKTDNLTKAVVKVEHWLSKAAQRLPAEERNFFWNKIAAIATERADSCKAKGGQKAGEAQSS